jgi:hypothetical protein
MADYDPRLLEPNQSLSTDRPKKAKQSGCRRFFLFGCLLPIGVVTALALALFVFVFTVIKNSDPYKVALAHANKSPIVNQTLGTPVEPDFLIEGHLKTENGVRMGTYSIPISGPKGVARLIVVAEKPRNKWRFTKLSLGIGTSGDEIDLLPELEHAQREF